MPIPLLRYEDIAETALKDLPAQIQSTERCRIGSLTLDDLAEVTEYPNGAYIFFREGDPIRPFYVGRVSSRSFLGRIPSHFEPREDYWMNALSKGLHKKGHAATYHSGVKAGLNCQAIFVGVRLKHDEALSVERKLLINALEIVLQEALKPELNGRHRNGGLELTVGDAVAQRCGLTIRSTGPIAACG